ncbi:hypothetical protein CYMTET_23357 [Cymbomonas tetramitiformis]|uniref:Uncharacterized protein n=1 Tax=Cymbomonas tetramitiformis TaxID=36881 RepID=A0AAE0FYE2_9CHLO|nr:hypothetical protein CYMTET_23357 [Cymbomonas tetramitiformis]
MPATAKAESEDSGETGPAVPKITEHGLLTTLVQEQIAEQNQLMIALVDQMNQLNAENETKGDSAPACAKEGSDQARPKGLPCIPYDETNPFASRLASLETRMPQRCDVHSDKTFDSLCQEELLFAKLQKSGAGTRVVLPLSRGSPQTRPDEEDALLLDLHNIKLQDRYIKSEDGATVVLTKEEGRDHKVLKRRLCIPCSQPEEGGSHVCQGNGCDAREGALSRQRADSEAWQRDPAYRRIEALWKFSGLKSWSERKARELEKFAQPPQRLLQEDEGRLKMQNGELTVVPKTKKCKDMDEWERGFFRIMCEAPLEAREDLVDFLAWAKTIAADFTFYHFNEFYEHLIRQELQRETERCRAEALAPETRRGRGSAALDRVEAAAEKLLRY